MGARAVGTGRPLAVRAISRPRLLSMLDLAAPRRLTTVVAPAGYGKTALLTEWTSARSDPIAWLALDQSHNRPGRLAADLTAAVRVLGAAASAVLVLDDFQEVSSEAALDECVAAIEQVPATLHIVVASRADPPPRYYRLRLTDSLAEVGTDDLAFKREEAAELLPASVVDEVMARTKGWALGVTLLGDERRVDDYLTREVLSPQSDDVRRFLLSTAVLDRMSGALCDFVIAGRCSQAKLEDLERSGAFVTSLDARRAWFVYHPMLRSLLLRLLREEGGTSEPELLHRAAEWHIRRGEIEEGVRYLIEAGADDEVVEAVFTHGPTMFEQHLVADVAGWIEHAPHALHDQARVPLLEAAALIFGNTPAGARSILDDVDAMTSALPAERLVGQLLRSYLELAEGVHAAAMAASDRVLSAIDSVDDADLPNLFGLTCSRGDVAAGARVARAVALMYDGELEEARRELEAVGVGVHGIWRASALGTQSLLEVWSGNLTLGEGMATQALSLADSLGHDAPSRTAAWLALALVARQRNDLGRATTLLNDVESAGGSRRRAVAVWVATERAYVALATNTAPAGLAALAGQLVSAHPSLPTGVLSRRWAAEVLLLIAAGDLDAATEVADVGLERGSSELLGAHVRLAVERGDMTRARTLVDAWPDEPLPRVRRERNLWMAILDHLDGSEASAAAAMAAVVAEAEDEGDVGLFQAAGKYAMGPARALYRAAPTVFLRELVDQPFIVGRAAPAKGLAEQLTDREYMVLVHLPGRQSNAEIANRLGVSLNTVKTHLKHIYRKLDVVGRSGAVEAAERLHQL